MKTILKWPGGKEKELPIIQKYMPEYTGQFIEPFVGGGAVFFNVDNEQCYINDKSYELINLYNCIKRKNADMINFMYKEIREFYSIGVFVENYNEDVLKFYRNEITIDGFLYKYNRYFLSLAGEYNVLFLKELRRNLNNKRTRTRTLEDKNSNITDKDILENMEAGMKSAYYMYIRYLHNHSAKLSCGQQAAIFFFIREYCYSSMFRYNQKGEFNVPYGGISYNKKNLKKKFEYLLSEELSKKLCTANISCMDFEKFLYDVSVKKDDFIFLDPPYDTEFSTYSQNKFGPEEQIRLCRFLKQTPAKIMLIIKIRIL
ncbi:MAG: DNA adenine methylase [Blautia hansenii]